MTYAGQDTPTTAHRIFLWAGLAVTVVVSVWLTRIARRALRQALPQEPSSENRGTEG